METWYMDTSAAVKLLVREDESPALIEAINTRAPLLCSSNLLITELSRAQQRTSSIRPAAVRNVLLRLQLIDVNRTVFEHSGLIPGANLRSLDAIHIAAALLGGCTSMVTYDHRMAEAAERSGLEIYSPGVSGS